MKNIDLRTTVMANRIMILSLGSALGLDKEALNKIQEDCTKLAEEEVNKMLEKEKEENENNK